jgi:REP element-mobilizing transposase RayT
MQKTALKGHPHAEDGTEGAIRTYHMNDNRALHGRLPRLSPEAYIGVKHVCWTTVTANRRTVFTRRALVDPVVNMLADVAKCHGCECLVYVFMPDHVHCVLHGMHDASNVLACHNEWKGVSGHWLCAQLDCRHVWQERSYDHVYRSREYERRALAKTINYILLNPVRKGLVNAWQEYPYLGSMVGDSDMRHPYWWEWFENEA